MVIQSTGPVEAKNVTEGKMKEDKGYISGKFYVQQP
jgi:hypothetical protein